MFVFFRRVGRARKAHETRSQSVRLRRFEAKMLEKDTSDIQAEISEYKARRGEGGFRKTRGGLKGFRGVYIRHTHFSSRRNSCCKKLTTEAGNLVIGAGPRMRGSYHAHVGLEGLRNWEQATWKVRKSSPGAEGPQALSVEFVGSSSGCSGLIGGPKCG